MKRTDITELFPNATDEQINKIMDLNGADINKAKGDMEELRSQLATAQSEITTLKNGTQPSEELKKAQEQISNLTTELEGMRNAEAIRTMREKVSAEKKIPAALLTGDTEEACAAQAEAILGFAKGNGYPQIPDGGEAAGAGTIKTANRDQFAAWAEKNL